MLCVSIMSVQVCLFVPLIGLSWGSLDFIVCQSVCLSVFSVSRFPSWGCHGGHCLSIYLSFCLYSLSVCLSVCLYAISESVTSMWLTSGSLDSICPSICLYSLSLLPSWGCPGDHWTRPLCPGGIYGRSLWDPWCWFVLVHPLPR